MSFSQYSNWYIFLNYICQEKPGTQSVIVWNECLLALLRYHYFPPCPGNSRSNRKWSLSSAWWCHTWWSISAALHNWRRSVWRILPNRTRTCRGNDICHPQNKQWSIPASKHYVRVRHTGLLWKCCKGNGTHLWLYTEKRNNCRNPKR